MDRHSLKVLEFGRICEFLNTFAASSGGKKKCTELIPSHDQKSMERLLDETSEMRKAVELSGPLILNSIYDIRDTIKKSKVPSACLEAEDLLKTEQTLDTAKTIKNFFAGYDEACPEIFKISHKIIILSDLTIRIRKCISTQGKILDSASPKLGEIRSRLAKLRLSVLNILEQLIQNNDLQHAVQDDFITIRNSRYVIPVRTDSKNMIPGVVHDQSQSKATFFVEPLTVVNLNNELQILHKDEYYEEIRILTELTGMVNEYREEILLDLDILEHIDLIHARALLSKALNGIKPTVNTDGEIKLINCRHPILISNFIEDEIQNTEAEDPVITGKWEFNRKGIVPIDIIKEKETRTLIITGANAGGKTVSMKTLGLFVLMSQAGIHLPAEKGSRISVFKNIFADIGDEQNIEASLSTFTAHMTQAKDILLNAGSSSLILFDELGSGTDPTEGGALAVAILDSLKERKSFTIVTTHLNILKTYAYSNDDVKNVSVEFDPATSKPSYKLVYGVPGISNALAIARNIGVPQDILDKAVTQVDMSDQQVAKLIHGLEATQMEMVEEKKGIRKITEFAKKHLRTTEDLFEKVRKRKDQILKKFETDSKKLLRESEDELMKIIKDQKKRRLIRPDDTQNIADNDQNRFQNVKEKLYSKFPKKDKTAKSPDQLEPGQLVRISHLQKNGTVVRANNKTRKAEISLGNITVKTGFNELELTERKAAKDPAKADITKKPPSVTKPVSSQSSSVNVIGMRVPDALPVIDKAIDNALLTGSERLEITHGRGTGTLMKAIHEYLKEHVSVSGFKNAPSDQGGAGITIAKIK
jgi:DNA mismatch repair protein MutS2